MFKGSRITRYLVMRFYFIGISKLSSDTSITGESILMADIGYETIELYKEEIDERYFTENEYDALPRKPNMY